MSLTTRKEVIEYCLTFPNVYEDYPFHDFNWTVMRCKKNKKTFALLYEKEEYIWINVKVDSDWIEVWRNAYESVVPGFHMNKKYWNSIILNETVPENDIKRMIAESYDLVKPKTGVMKSKLEKAKK